MYEVISRHPEVIEAAEEAMRRAGWSPCTRSSAAAPTAPASRSGAADAEPLHRRLEYHFRREWASVQDMAAAAAMIVELARVWAQRS